jgi:hypothetical protein
LLTTTRTRGAASPEGAALSEDFHHVCKIERLLDVNATSPRPGFGARTREKACTPVAQADRELAVKAGRLFVYWWQGGRLCVRECVVENDAGLGTIPGLTRLLDAETLTDGRDTGSESDKKSERYWDNDSDDEGLRDLRMVI